MEADEFSFENMKQDVLRIVILRVSNNSERLKRAAYKELPDVLPMAVTPEEPQPPGYRIDPVTLFVIFNFQKFARIHSHFVDLFAPKRIVPGALS